jgi:uncharacterized protein YndB with AHSA1/START domain
VAVDVQTEIVIDLPCERVAAYAADPANASEWYVNIKSVEWQTPPPWRWARVAFVAQFLGRRLAYTYEIVDLIPNERLTMRTAEGPFPMETTYTWEPRDDGGTRMTLRNRGGTGRRHEIHCSAHGCSDAPREPQGPCQAEGLVGEDTGVDRPPCRPAHNDQCLTTLS